jgi:heme-degrading monooxygenase HmoA
MEDSVIVRLWKGRAVGESAAAYQEYVTTTVFPKLEQIEGYIGGRILRRVVDGVVEFAVVTEWASFSAVRSFAGDTSDRAVVEPEARALLLRYDEYVEHFEVIEESRRKGST